MPITFSSSTSHAIPQVKTQAEEENYRSHHLESAEHRNIIKEVLESHDPDGSKVDAKDLLDIIQNILPFSNRCVNLLRGTEKMEALLKDASTNLGNSKIIPDGHAKVIDKLLCELSCQCSSVGEIPKKLFKVVLSKYEWHDKLVLMVSAFAVYYGEFGLFNLLHRNNVFATNIGILRRVPNIRRNSDILKNLISSITGLVDVICEATKGIVQFNDLPSSATPEISFFDLTAGEIGNLKLHESLFSSANSKIRELVCWIVFSIVNCSFQIGQLRTSRDALAIKKVVGDLTGYKIRIEECKHDIGIEIGYSNIKHIVKKKFHEDNLEILKALFKLKDDQLPLVIGRGTPDPHPNSTLKGKEVLLLITRLHRGDTEIKRIIKDLTEAYKNPKTKLGSHYHVVWIPIVDEPYDESLKNSIQSDMPWYAVQSLDMIRPGAKKFIREEWKFTNKTMIMHLHFNAQGILQSENLIELISCWGMEIFPLTTKNFNSVIRNNPPNVESSIRDIYQIDKTVSIRIIYGGEDIYWIKKLKTLAKKVVQKTSRKIELIYMTKGKDIDHEELTTHFHDMVENLKSSKWIEIETINQFWSRWESIYSFGIRNGSINDDETRDKIIDIISMHNYKSSYEGWAMFSETGSSKMTKAKGKLVLDILSKISSQWEQHQHNGFIETIDTFIRGDVTPRNHCNHIALPSSIAEIVGDKLKCGVCGCGLYMEKYQIMYHCCVDQ